MPGIHLLALRAGISYVLTPLCSYNFKSPVFLSDSHNASDPMTYRIPGLVLTLAFWLTTCISTGCWGQNFRNWTTKDGTRSKTRLKLVDSNDTQVRLQREDNDKIITMKLSALSSLDRLYLRKQNKPDPAVATSDRENVGEWPQWRGPNRDGKSPAVGLLTQWPDAGPKLIWNVTGLGKGYSTPAVVGDKVYVLGTKGGEEFIFAISVDDGSKLWDARMGSISEGGGFKGPKGTPTIDDDKIYAIGSDGTLVCVKRDGGEEVWQKNFKSDFGGQHGSWDYAESPLVDGEKLICTPGGGKSTLVALNKSNGAPIWKSPIGSSVSDGFARAGYSSAIVATIGGTRQYINFLHGGVVGVAANNGQPLWHYDNPANTTANCSTPVALGDSVFAASGYGTGGGRAQVVRQGGNWDIREKYFVKQMQSHHGGFILHDGYIYGTNNSVLMCLDWKTGDIRWKDRCVGKGSVSLADGHLYVRGEGGAVALVAATPDSYQEKGRFEQPDRSDKNAWAHPVVARDRLYLHDQDRLLCYELK